MLVVLGTYLAWLRRSPAGGYESPWAQASDEGQSQVVQSGRTG